MDLLKQLIREIHRRSIWQVVAIYAAASWAVIEAVGGLTETAGLPEWFPPLAMALLLVGFPIVVATAFVQEGTGGPEVSPAAAGPAKESRAPRPVQSDGPAAARRIFTWRNAVLGGLAAGALWGVLATAWIVRGGQAPSADLAPTTEVSAPRARALGQLPAVAVLPLTNMSPDAEFTFFADGIHEDILTNLSKVEGLLVLSRTSVLRYRDTAKGMGEIGAELGADAILEGSVRRFGDQVRISAQLIDPESDTHLWAETYDRELTDVFAIQSEIAHEVTRALDATLTPEEERRIASGAASDMTAYDLYLEGRQLYGLYEQPTNERAIELFKRAIDLDPQYGLAWAGLADAYAQNLIRWGATLDWTDSAVAAARTAVDYAPERSEAHKALGLALAQAGRGDDALQAYRTALELDPNNAAAVNNIGAMSGIRGNQDEAIPMYRLAARLNPTGAFNASNLAIAYSFLGLIPQAEEALERAREVGGPERGLVFAEAMIALNGGRIDQVREIAERYARSEPSDAGVRAQAAGWLFNVGERNLAEGHAREALHLGSDLRPPPLYASPRLVLGLVERSREAHVVADSLFEVLMERLERYEGINPTPGWAFQIGVIHGARGDMDEALHWLEVSYERGNKIMSYWENTPELDPVREEPRFQDLLARIRENHERMRANVLAAEGERPIV